jgi:hypothetical protein
MTDIVKRLRDFYVDQHYDYDADAIQKAADEIERLRQIVEIAADWLRDYKISHAHNAELNGMRAATLELFLNTEPKDVAK